MLSKKSSRRDLLVLALDDRGPAADDVYFPSNAIEVLYLLRGLLEHRDGTAAEMVGTVEAMLPVE